MSKLLKFIKVFLSIKTRRTRLNFLPLEVSVEVTNKCNFNCSFCHQSSKSHHLLNPVTYLSTDNARVILQKIRDFGYDSSLIHWTLDGEPFMNKEFHEISSLGVEYGFTTQYFATNASLITISKAKLLSPGGRYVLTVDYCSDPEFFETYRGSKGSWERIKENIINILNHAELSNISFNITDISSYKFDNKSELKEKFQNLKNMFPQSNRIRFYTKTFHNAQGLVDAANNDKSKYYVCPYPWTSLNISSSGDIVACCRDLERKSILGNIFQHSLAEIWNGSQYMEFRENILNKKVHLNKACIQCDMPYDQAKHSIKNKIRTALNRLQLFKQS